MSRKKRSNILDIVIVSVILILVSCATGLYYFNGKEKNIAQETHFSPEINLQRRIDGILTSMSDEEKIGQIMFVGVGGEKLNSQDLDFLQNKHVGGVVLFDRNMSDPDQVKELNKAIQDKGTLVVKNKKLNETVRIPLFIAVDEEGGLVSRMKEKWPDGIIPSQEKIGLSKNPQLAKDWAKKVSKSMKYMGFNVNFAPVADVNSADKRSYSKNHEEVTNFVDAAMQGYAEEGIISTLKHFPGIGRAVVDSHYEGSVIREDLATLEKSDLVPFKTIIKQRDNKTFMVMISHLTYAALDKESPSSVSKKIVSGLLKEQVGYTGLILTDDLEMGAVAKHYTFEEMGVKAINAGVDMALVCHEPKHILEIYNGLLNAYKNGTISKARIDECVRKILTVKISAIKQ